MLQTAISGRKSLLLAVKSKMTRLCWDVNVEVNVNGKYACNKLVFTLSLSVLSTQCAKVSNSDGHLDRAV